MKIEVWSDIVCPWCYIGKRRLESALADYPGDYQVIWRSFQLNPRAPIREEESLTTLLSRKYNMTTEGAQTMIANVTQSAAEEGLEFHLDQAKSGNTLAAQTLIQWAQSKGFGDALKERLMKAYFSDALPVSDPATLVACAVDVGLDAEEASEALNSEEWKNQVEFDAVMAQKIGIRGVPFFVFDSQVGVSGAQPAEVLRDVLKKVSAGADSAESCEDDACAV